MRNLILICLACLLMYTGCQQKHPAQSEELTFPVTNPIQKDTLVYREYVCQIRSSQHIELRALEKGYLQQIYVDEGQHIKKGQLMFRILPLIYQAEMQRARAEVNFTEIEYQNTKNLADSSIVSSRELALAKAKLDKAEAELALAQAHLGFTEIRAPFAGIMNRFHVRTGSLIDEGELLTTLSDNSRMWVYFNVPEAEYLDYVLSRTDATNLPKVRLQLANKHLFDQNGIVETIEADFNNETGNIAFRATFPNPKGILRHGETGNILMPVPLKKAVIIPQKATFEILDRKYVFVVDEGNTVQSKEITVCAELPHLYVVTEGLSTNDKILVEGLRRVKNNQKINYDLLDFHEILSGLNNLHAE